MRDERAENPTEDPSANPRAMGGVTALEDAEAHRMRGAQQSLDQSPRTLDDFLITVEKTAAAVAGALEGYRNRLEEDHPGEAVREAMEAARETRESVTSGAQAWNTPEMRRVGESVKHGATDVGQRTSEYASAARYRTTDAARRAKGATTAGVTRARDTVSGATASAKAGATRAAHTTRDTAADTADVARERGIAAKRHATETVTEAREAATEQYEHAREFTTEKYRAAQHTVQETAHDVKVKAEAVQESGRRGVRAPGMIMRDVKQGVSEMTANYGRALGMIMGAAVLAFTAFILLTIFLVVALNALLGDPWGTLVTTLLWAVIAGVAAWGAKKAVGDAKDAKNDMRERVREDVDYVKRPVRREFGGRA